MNRNFESTSPNGFFTYIIALLIWTTEIASDMFSPSLPRISHYFGVHLAIAQLIISFYIVGLGLSSLFYGMLSDQYGRRPILIYGFSLFCLGSLICIFSPTLYFLFLSRFIQGIGAGVVLPVCISMISDVCDTLESSRMMSKIGMVIAISPGLAPVMGGYIATAWGWESIFIVLSGISFYAWILCYYKLPETLRTKKKEAPFLSNFSSIFKQMTKLLKNPDFFSFALIHALIFAFVFSEAVTLPFLYIGKFKIQQQHFGFFMAFTISIYVMGAFLNTKYISKVGMKKMLIMGVFLHLFSCFILAVLSLTPLLTPYFIQTLKIPGTIGIAFIFGNAIPQALSFVDVDIRGTASSFICFIQMALGAFITGLISLLYNNSSLSLYGVSLFFACLCVGLLKKGFRLHFFSDKKFKGH